MIVAKDTVVQFHYVLTNANGDTMDDSTSRDPMLFLQGYGSLIKGLEMVMNGKKKGDKFTAAIASDDAYGPYHEDLIHVVTKEGFQQEDGEALYVGLQVQVETNNGVTLALVTKIEGEDVTLDLNHPLAGMDLNFDVDILDVREATKEELEHGHAHGAGGHQH